MKDVIEAQPCPFCSGVLDVNSPETINLESQLIHRSCIEMAETQRPNPPGYNPNDSYT